MRNKKDLLLHKLQLVLLVLKHLLPLSLELYHNGSVKLEAIIQALTSNPAKILKINKGNLTIGNEC